MTVPIDDDRIRELLLSGDAEKIKAAVPAMTSAHVPPIQAALHVQFPSLKADHWEGIWNEVFQDINRMVSKGDLWRTGSLRSLLSLLAWRRASNCLKKTLSGRIDWNADIVEPVHREPANLFSLLDAIQAYVVKLPDWKRALLITAVELLTKNGAKKLSQLPLEPLVSAVNDLVDPPMSPTAVRRALHREWGKLRGFLQGEGY